MCGAVSLVEEWLNQPFAAPSEVCLDKVMERFVWKQHWLFYPVCLFNHFP
jgi:hypothetical protein